VFHGVSPFVAWLSDNLNAKSQRGSSHSVNLLFYKLLSDSHAKKATGWTIGVLGFDFRRGVGIFLFTTAPRTALGPTQPPIQWVLESPSLGVKRPGREADHSPPSTADVKE
jgi:hypothetical protein